jgi:hypothetical protein
LGEPHQKIGVSDIVLGQLASIERTNSMAQRKVERDRDSPNAIGLRTGPSVAGRCVIPVDPAIFLSPRCGMWRERG